MAQGAEGWYRGRTVEDDDTFTAHITAKDTGWSLGLAIPTEQIYGAATRAAWTVSLGILTTLAAGLAFAYFLSLRIAKPIGALAARARDPRSPASPVHSNIAELAEVERSFEQAQTAISERQGLEERERVALLEADRAKDEFLAMLGHELRNPLAAIRNSSFVLRALPDGERTRRAAALAILERQASQMTRLVDDLLEVSRLTVGKITLRMETFDLAALARSLVDTWERTGRVAAGRVQVDAPVPAWVHADRSRMEQVTANLLDNAHKFATTGSAIELSVAVHADSVILQVADRGPGIDPELLPHIFERFVQGHQGFDRAGGGLGLGLAVVRRLVELQGGTVEAANRSDPAGARFTVRQPRATAPSAAPAAVAEPLEPNGLAPPRRRALRILVVEDRDDTRETMELALQLEGYEVVAVGSGAQALSEALRAPPDAVLLDLGLPDLSGHEVAKRLRSELRLDGTWIIALTGYGQSADERQSREAGCDLHLLKPVDLQALATLLAALGQRPVPSKPTYAPPAPC